MGTLSNRPISDFGYDIKEKIEDFRSNVGSRIDGMREHADEHGREEGRLMRAIQRLTRALPSSTWLVFAGTSLIGSIALKAIGRNHASIFVGQWVPTFLLLGMFNKIVKRSSAY